MIKYISEHLAEKIISINDDVSNKKIYIYGLQIVLNTICTFLIIGICGIIFHGMIATLFFLFCYCSIRLWAGGYHASTNERCMSMFIIMYLLVNIFFTKLSFDFVTLLGLLIVENIMILNLAPIAAVNNPIPEQLLGEMRIKSVTMASLVSIMVLVVFYWNEPIGIFGFWGISWLVILLIMGKIQQFIGGYRNEKNYE